MPHRSDIQPAAVRLGVLIRFKDSAATLPEVLSALRAQTLIPDLILGVDTGSSDESPALLRAAGAEIVRWPHAYHHARVLNFGLAHCPAERVLILSSHTVLRSPDALARLSAALDDPATACASGFWDDDRYYSEAISWEELRAKGLKVASIYSNSFGMLRRTFWEEVPFDETMPTMEDYAWALEQVRRGRVCRRVPFEFSYQRSPSSRELEFTACAFRLAAQHGLPLRWLGRRGCVEEMMRGLAPGASEEQRLRGKAHRDRLLASLFWRWTAR